MEYVGIIINIFKVIAVLFVCAIGLFGLYVYNSSQNTIYKPIIYLYPKEDMNISVKLGKKENITCSYPKYIDGWNVFAKTNGDLVDNDTGRSLYSLYYEADKDKSYKMEDCGFVVKGEDSANFLEEKLEVLGLNEREAEEFIIYWLPKLEENKYNYIRFASMKEIENDMPIMVDPKPDTIIRVMMVYKPLDKYVEVQEQELEKVTRQGYTVVEWGGTLIK